MRSMRSSRRRNRVNADISLTNLIDVAFVLLIIFMITAPIMQGGIDVELPEAESVPLTSGESIVISISRTGELFVGETSVEMAELRGVIEAQRAAAPDRPVVVKADRESIHEPFAQVLGILQGMGIRDVGLPVLPAS